MRAANMKSPGKATKQPKSRLNAKQRSFRNLKAFGMWSKTDDVTLMAIPTELVPEVRALLARKQSA